MPAEQPTTLTDRLRQLTEPTLARAGAFLAGLGVHPDWVSLAGLLFIAVAAYFLATGEFLAAGLLFLLSAPLDALDGAVARALNRSGSFGMVLDSTLDRYADGVIFAAFSYYFAVLARLDMLLLALAALVGSYLVSYIRARADDARVGVSTTVGFFTRMERVIAVLVMVFAAAALESDAPLEIGLLVLALGTNFTALQRLRYVQKSLKARGD